jgi:hypothetical protein
MDGRQIRCVDLHDRDVSTIVDADQLGLEFALVGERDVDVVGVVHHVGVGHDIAILRQDETGPYTAALLGIGIVGRILTAAVAATPAATPVAAAVIAVIAATAAMRRAARLLRHRNAEEAPEELRHVAIV